MIQGPLVKRDVVILVVDGVVVEPNEVREGERTVVEISMYVTCKTVTIYLLMAASSFKLGDWNNRRRMLIG